MSFLKQEQETGEAHSQHNLLIYIWRTRSHLGNLEHCCFSGRLVLRPLPQFLGAFSQSQMPNHTSTVPLLALTHRVGPLSLCMNSKLRVTLHKARKRVITKDLWAKQIQELKRVWETQKLHLASINRSQCTLWELNWWLRNAIMSQKLGSSISREKATLYSQNFKKLESCWFISKLSTWQQNSTLFKEDNRIQTLNKLAHTMQHKMKN
jgi:hypothetical protein